MALITPTTQLKLINDLTNLGTASSADLGLKDLSVSTAKLQDDSVVFSKLQNLENDTVIGNTTGGGDPQEVTIVQDLNAGDTNNIASSEAIKNYLNTAIFGSFDHDIEGYEIFPSGLILQWGKLDVSANTESTTKNFLLPFTTIYNLSITEERTGGGDTTQNNIYVESYNNTTFTVENDNGQTWSVNYFAIGV
jgi:hypothetical protein